MNDQSASEPSVARSDDADPPPTQAASRWHPALGKVKGTVMAIAAVGAVLSGLAGYWTTYRSVATIVTSTPNNSAAVTDPLSILVLPFTNETGDEAKAYVADSLTTSIISDLPRIQDAFVIPVATAFSFKNTTLSVQQIGKEAAVRFVLQGSVMASGDKLRITAQLAQTQDGVQLWNETFEGTLGDLFALQDKVTARVGNSIKDHMVIAAARESQTRKSSSMVADLMMRARALQVRPQSIQNFIDRESLYRKVLEQEPDNLNAMVSLAGTLAIHAQWLDESNPAQEKMFTEARDLALKAKAVEPDFARAYLPLAIYADTHNDFDGALRAYEAMVLNDPKNPNVYNNLAVHFRRRGEPERALPLLQKAVALYPKGNDTLFANYGGTYLELGHNDTALEWLLKAVDAGSKRWDLQADLAMAYSNKGDMKNAAIHAAEYRRLATAAGIAGGIDDSKFPPGTPEAFVKQWRERYVPEWKKAGLP